MQAAPRAQALTKLLALGDLVQAEIIECMGGDVQDVLHAQRALMQAGTVSYRNCGRGERVYFLARRPASGEGCCA